MPLEPGTSLGPYEILAPLGAGAMGEVYRARDPRLDREVAIKVLPDELAEPERLRRFEQEARAAGALHHPKSRGAPFPSASASGTRFRSPAASPPPTARASSTAT